MAPPTSAGPHLARDRRAPRPLPRRGAGRVGRGARHQRAPQVHQQVGAGQGRMGGGGGGAVKPPTPPHPTPHPPAHMHQRSPGFQPGGLALAAAPRGRRRAGRAGHAVQVLAARRGRLPVAPTLLPARPPAHPPSLPLPPPLPTPGCWTGGGSSSPRRGPTRRWRSCGTPSASTPPAAPREARCSSHRARAPHQPHRVKRSPQLARPASPAVSRGVSQRGGGGEVG